MEILPFRAPALSPLEAHVFNLLCTRAQPWPIDVAGTPCALEAGGLAAPVPPVCGERTWRVELGSLRLLALHPAVADVPPNAALPEALQLAVLDLLAAPLAELAQTFLHMPLAVRNARMIEAAEPAVCALPLTLRVPVGAGASAEAYPIPVRLCLPDRESALELAERLDALPRRRALGLAGDVPVPVSLEAGRMRLSVNELSSLEPDDVLLPETYPELSPGRKRGRERRSGVQLRLFMALGKAEGYGAGKLLELIFQKTGLRSNRIGKVDSFDHFSFLEVDADDAELLLKAFRRAGHDGAPLVAVARAPEEDDADDPTGRQGQRPSDGAGNRRQVRQELSGRAFGRAHAARRRPAFAAAVAGTPRVKRKQIK